MGSRRGGTSGPDEAAARMIERVLSDSAFRARFRRDPVGAAREAGVEPLEEAAAANPALETLELRESKSSLAGALMAAAVEGVGLYELVDQLAGGRGGDVVSRALSGIGVSDAEAAVAPASPEALALLRDGNVEFDPEGVADLRAGRIDPRIVAVLHEVAKSHRISVSALMSDHAVNTANGSVSNHHFGRAVDIAVIDGRPVSPDNRAARELAAALLRLDPRIRPTELGSPWALPDPVAFTDGDHQDHIHVAFDDPVQPGRAPPLATPQDADAGEGGDPESAAGAEGADAPEDDADVDDDADDDDAGDGDDADADADDADDDGDGDGDTEDDEDDADDEDDEDDEDDDADDDDDSDTEDDEDDEDDDDDSDTEDDGDDEPDEDEPDEDEPDEDEPDEDEPDEVGPDQDDLTDDERGADGGDTDDSASGGDDDGDSDDSASGGDDDGDSDDSASGGDDDGDEDTAQGSDDGGGDAELDLGDADSAYPGDQAPRERVAAWMAAKAQRRGLPPELPVMAALVESGMRNLPGGDADSAGFFQMRAGIWDNGAYAGYSDRPELQLDWFLDHAEAVRRQRVAGGLPLRDPDHYGEWIADVERPAAQYRGRYQLRLAEARDLLRRGSGGGAGEDLVDGAATGAPLAGPRARAALAEARRYLGTPYRWGGSTPTTGFDCSGLVQWAYAKAGIRIPRVTDQQILAPGAAKVDRDHLLPGDLVFFRDPTGYVHHVGISLGGRRFLHAPHTGDVVKVSNLDEPYYRQQFTGGRRFDAPAGAGSSPDARPGDAATAQAALERDAAEVSRPGSGLFRAIEAQESRKQHDVQVLPAIRPDQVRRRSR
jgi:cell wall-associated NlpC family hydrolase